MLQELYNRIAPREVAKGINKSYSLVQKIATGKRKGSKKTQKDIRNYVLKVFHDVMKED